VEEFVRYAESLTGRKLPAHPAYAEQQRVLSAHALNHLQPRELPCRPGAAAVYRVQNLLFNEPDSIDTTAQAL
jgi:hypothetical protein